MRWFNNTRETEEETKKRVWRDHGWIVIKLDADPMHWTLRELLTQWATGRWGKRQAKGGSS